MAAVVQVSLVVSTVARQAEPEVVHPVCAVQAVKANKSRVRQGMIRMQQVPHRTHTLWQHVRARLITRMMADALHTVYAGRRTQDS